MAGGYLMTDFTVNPVNMRLDTPQPRHAANALDMYRTGMDDRALQDKGFLRQQVGGALASGESPLEAAQMAFAGGDVKTGIDLQELPRERLVGLMEWLPKAAKATGGDPQKWNILMERARPVFGTDLDPYSDPSTMEALIKDAEDTVSTIKEIDGRESIVSYSKSDPSKATITPLGTGEGAPGDLAGFKDKKQKVDVEAGMRKEFSALSKDFRDVRDAYRRVDASASDPSAAGDLALIFNYMKILDPGSVVREGEFANAQNSGGVPERVQALYNSVLRGERLSTSIRGDFVDRTERLYAAQKDQHAKLVGDFKSRAERLGLDVTNVLPDFGSAEPSVDAEGVTSNGRTWTGRR